MQAVASATGGRHFHASDGASLETVFRELALHLPRGTDRLMQKKTSSNRTGAATVEFAIVATIVFTLLLAAIAFSRVNSIRHTVQNAAYEGARRGMVPGATAVQIETVAQDVLNAVMITNATISVSPATILDTTPTVTVDVAVPLTENLFTTSELFNGQTLRASCTLTRESFAPN